MQLNGAHLLGLALVGALVVLGMRRRQGDTLPGEAPEVGPAALPGTIESIWRDVTLSELPVYDPRDAQARQGNRNAFLATIAAAEGTDAAGGYRALYGSSASSPRLFSDWSDHPALLGWSGVPLADATCIAAGYSPGCVSTAAGRYQITRPTWRALAAQISLGDFSPASQDSAALELARQNGALEMVDAGELDGALDRVRKVWASLPGSGYGQPEAGLDDLRAVFVANGGVLT